VSAHSQIAFTISIGRATTLPRAGRRPIAAAADPEARNRDHAAVVGISGERAAVALARGLALTEARNQMPTTLLFATVAVDTKLGAQTFGELQRGLRRGRW
jgi:hypothetical protein